MSEYSILLEMAKTFHGDACPGIIMGTRMSIAGMRELGMNPLERNRNLLVYVEIDRCATDAIQAITGCTLGHRTLKFMNYGKFAAIFVNMDTGKAVRIAAIPKQNGQGENMAETVQKLAVIPESELFSIREVSIRIPEEDLPGFPLYKEICSVCGEQVLDKKEVVKDNRVFCKNCQGKSYYSYK
ncbi:MAG: FmdE family protein [Methanospirillum sp.]|uniref:FmdE family protein n=1 Tax=Methanospirillum sp. TaxID=45200 RepID=UPI00236B6760|nr:FmdE family protein [Methanospirillum sp.]MDD1728589.1 FmdE family protein [Methanospirillum sp.]